MHLQRFFLALITLLGLFGIIVEAGPLRRKWRKQKTKRPNHACGIHILQYGLSRVYTIDYRVVGPAKSDYALITEGGADLAVIYKEQIPLKWLAGGYNLTIQMDYRQSRPFDPVLLFTYGTDTWTSRDKRCSVGGWDNLFHVHRQMDCRFACDWKCDP